MVLRALAVLAPLRSYALRIGSRPFQQAVATLVGVAVLSLGASTAWGLSTVNFGWNQRDPITGDAPSGNPQDLTFYFGTPTADLPLEVQHSALAAALGKWSSVTAVRFSETSLPNQPRSIDINFCPFSTCFPSQPSNVLALTFLPPDVAPIEIGTLSGDTFFNSNFRWEVGNGLGSAAFDLTYLGVHEFGHSLGLRHSDNPDSVMFPFISANQTFTGFNQEEISAVQFLYGPPSPVPEPSTLVLLGTTAAGLGLARLRQRRRKQQPTQQRAGRCRARQNLAQRCPCRTLNGSLRPRGWWQGQGTEPRGRVNNAWPGPSLPCRPWGVG